jgi:hypothetical protein
MYGANVVVFAKGICVRPWTARHQTVIHWDLMRILRPKVTDSLNEFTEQVCDVFCRQIIFEFYKHLVNKDTAWAAVQLNEGGMHPRYLLGKRMRDILDLHRIACLYV